MIPVLRKQRQEDSWSFLVSQQSLIRELTDMYTYMCTHTHMEFIFL